MPVTVTTTLEEELAEDITLRIVNGNTEAHRFWAGLGLQPTITVANAQPTRILEAIEKKTNKDSRPAEGTVRLNQP